MITPLEPPSKSLGVPSRGASLRRTDRHQRGIKTLVVHSKNVPGWKRVIGDTFSGALRMARIPLSRNLRRWRYLRFLVAEEYETLSYVVDWRDAFLENDQLDVDLCNITNLFEYSSYLRRIRDYELVVVLHSAAGDNLNLLSFAAPLFQNRRAPLVVFFGNEYSLMPEKIGFARRVGAEYIASQLPIEPARWLYEECTGSTVLPLPAALNPRVYRDLGTPRPNDIGFRGALYPISIGDMDRTKVLHFFRGRGAELGLKIDIDYTRCAAEQWNEFLNSCKATVGAEAGTKFLERDNTTQTLVTEYLNSNPSATFEEIHERFLARYHNPVSGKAISSRHFEAIGAKTCQLLCEGNYNGILEPDRHYISLRHDFSNLNECIERLKDPTHLEQLAERAHAHVMENHTYAQRVERLLKDVLFSRQAQPARSA